MWRLWHRLFGWDYVIMCATYRNVFEEEWTQDVILRVQHDVTGRPFVQYGGRITFVSDISEYLTK